MENFKKSLLSGILACFCLGTAHADYVKGTTMFQIYGGGAGLGGHYHQPGVDKEEQLYAEGGGIVGGQFLYFFHDSPCLAMGFDVSHASFGSHESHLMLANRFTSSSAENTTGVVILRLSYPKGHFRPYIQGGIGAHHTSLSLNGSPFNASVPWMDTGTTEPRKLLEDGHVGGALEGAIGMHIYFTEKFFIGAELKILRLGGKDFAPTAAGVHEGLLPADGRTSESGLGFIFGFGF